MDVVRSIRLPTRWMAMGIVSEAANRIAAGAVGGVLGLWVAQQVVSALSTPCMYACYPNAAPTGGPHAPVRILIESGGAAGGACLAFWLFILTTTTIKRFAGPGSKNLSSFTTRRGATLEWSTSEGGIRITNSDVRLPDAHVDSQAKSGSIFIPAGRYQLSVTADGPWTIRIVRG
jgi:hypothetical protein